MSNIGGSPTSVVISFGPYRLLPAERLLMKGDEPLPLGGRALDILIALVDRAGEVVERRELLARAWPGLTVEEANLRVHIASLRKAIRDGREGARYVVNIPGRGYCFVAPVARSIAHARSPPAQVAVATRLQMLPATSTRIVGRAGTVQALSEQLMLWRLVSIIGPGGIGKTTVAVAVAHALFDGFSGAVFFVDLAPLTDPQLVPTTVASALGLMVQTQDPLVSLATLIGNRKILLVLDNCEHVIDVAAPLAERIVSEAPETHVLASSREALRVEGEHVHLLHALDCPPEDADITAVEALRYPAAQLLMERAAASGYCGELTDAEAPIAARICRRLDGIPLAIELVASGVGSHGIHGTAELLENRFGLLWRGRRTALPRHQTLDAMLDWSYHFLADHEKVVLRRLSVLVGDFKLDAAVAVACETEADPAYVIAAVASLAEKSLISTPIVEGSTYYRLLDTTRSYALKKLDESGERGWIARRHAEYYRKLFERAEAEWRDRPTAEWLGEFGWRIDNLRAALDWAFSPHGDEVLGIALTTAAICLWMNLSLLEECRTHVERALASLTAAAIEDARREMKLLTARGASLAYTGGTVSQIEEVWARTRHLAESLGDVEHQLCALFGLWGLKDREALALAQQFSMVAVTPADRLVGERMIGNSYHYLGDQILARRQFERVIADDVISGAGSCIRWFHVNERPWAQVFLARILWLQGFPVQAADSAQNIVEQQRTANLARPLCLALSRAACPIALWTGDLDLAGNYLELLRDYSTRHGLTVWQTFGRAYEGMLFIRRGQLSHGIRLVCAAFDKFERAFSGYRALIFLNELAEAFGRAGLISEGLATISKASARAEQTAERWILPEILRVKAELLILRGGDEAVVRAYDHMRQALDCARQQGALSWELRAATSAARVLRDQDRRGDAVAILEPVYGRFTEGFETVDLKSARALLDSLR
jgi:predicted ATPase/DNA-binding winged helix-turn-helix (wHTH) protein